MDKKQYIEEMNKMLSELNEAQLCYIHNYTKLYFDFEEAPENND